MEKENFRIISFIGSLRDGETKRIVLNLEKEIKNTLNFSYEFINYQTNNIYFCTGCKQCFTNGKCTLSNDKISEIKQSIQQCDLFIFATPVYEKHISGLSKTFLDRIASWTHLMPLAGKMCILVITTYNTGIDESTSYLYEIMNYLGFTVIGIIVKSVRTSEQDLKNQVNLALNHFLRVLNHGKCHSSIYLEECFSAYQMLYNNLKKKNVMNHETIAWISQEYDRFYSFKDIINSIYNNN